MGPNNMQVHQLNKDNNKTSNAWLFIKIEMQTIYLPSCSLYKERPKEGLQESELAWNDQRWGNSITPTFVRV